MQQTLGHQIRQISWFHITEHADPNVDIQSAAVIKPKPALNGANAVC